MPNFQPKSVYHELYSKGYIKSHYNMTCFCCGMPINKGDLISRCVEDTGMTLRSRLYNNNSFYTVSTGASWVHKDCFPQNCWTYYSGIIEADLQNNDDIFNSDYYDSDSENDIYMNNSQVYNGDENNIDNIQNQNNGYVSNDEYSNDNEYYFNYYNNYMIYRNDDSDTNYFENDGGDNSSDMNINNINNINMSINNSSDDSITNNYDLLEDV